MSGFEEFFRQVAEDYPRWNFIWLYEPRQSGKILSGIWMTVKLAVACVILSVVIGIIGSWLQGARSAILRAFVQRSEERRVGKECRSRWSPYH